ncbi:hypothetical protein PENSPDRAFT_196333 [Peniophora sp. CONT]|nr:hypothetical protein PENSPDRAFT_196333 [Peniophora sp. CONT]
MRPQDSDSREQASTTDAYTLWTRCYEASFCRAESTQIITSDSRLEAYDVEIEAAMHAVSALRHRRNRLRPIVRLPPEILLCIMRECSDFRSTCAMNYISPNWLALTQICQTFRNVALGHTTLWTNFTTYLGWRWGQEFMKRSHGLLTGLHIHPWANNKTMAGLLRHMYTVERLSIESGGGTDWDALTPLLACSSPNMSEVILLGVSPSIPHLRSANAIDSAPLLRDLTMIKSNVVWKPSLWPNLCSLKINPSRHVPFVESFTDIIECLRASPDLEHLELIDCLPSVPAHSPREVLLPRLSSLTLRDLTDVCLAVLKAVEAPHLVKLDVDFLYRRNITVPINFDELAHVLKTYRLPLHSVMMTKTPYGHALCIQGWSSPLGHLEEKGAHLSPWSHPKTFDTPKLRILLDDKDIILAATSLCKALPLTELRALSIMLPVYHAHYDLQWNRDTWQSILTCAHHLQSLRVYESRCDVENTPVLCRLLATPPSHENHAVYLPVLRSLTLGHVELDREYMGVPFFRKLLQFLHRRAGLGAGIHTLRLEDCSEAARALDECFLGVPGLAVVEHEGDGRWDRACRIEESDVQVCMRDGRGDVAQDDAIYGW